MGSSLEDGLAAKKRRGGLSASELPHETLYAGDTISYYTTGFGLGDPPGASAILADGVVPESLQPRDSDGDQCNQSDDSEEERNSTGVYHAKTAEAIFVNDYLQKPGVGKRLEELRSAQPVYQPPAASDGYHLYSEVVPWPDDVTYIQRNRVPKEIRFPRAGRLGKCDCIVDCFKDVCLNSASAIYCTRKSCRLKGRCSNAPCDRSTLRLLRTRTNGLGVFTTAPMWTGDIVGEYVGQLLAFEGMVDGEPPKAWKYNSGYTLLFNTRSTNKKFIYVVAASCDSITRFINHACRPNADFVEMSNGPNTKVLVVMNRPVTPGMEITVNYGNDMGFKCHCDDCE